MKKAHTDPRVDAKIAAAAAFAQPILRHVRALVHKACPEAEETIKWNMPCFEHRGILCMMAPFKTHCAVVFWHRGMKAVLGADGAKADDAMGSLGRITCMADLPSDAAMLRYIKEAAALNVSGAPARVKAKLKPKSADVVPAELAGALKKNSKAAATFNGLSPSGRRDYSEWITEAKREETRSKRLATTLEWLAEGKARNWKYERCQEAGGT